jgi:hypothetical protein
MKTKRRMRLVILCLSILSVAMIFFFRAPIIFQRGNPLPYVSKMLSLNKSNPYSQVFIDDDIFITKRNTDGFVGFIEAKYDVIFIDQMGSAYFFASDEKSIIADTELYWKYYLVWELTISNN